MSATIKQRLMRRHSRKQHTRTMTLTSRQIHLIRMALSRAEDRCDDNGKLAVAKEYADLWCEFMHDKWEPPIETLTRVSK